MQERDGYLCQRRAVARRGCWRRQALNRYLDDRHSDSHSPPGRLQVVHPQGSRLLCWRRQGLSDSQRCPGRRADPPGLTEVLHEYGHQQLMLRSAVCGLHPGSSHLRPTNVSLTHVQHWGYTQLIPSHAAIYIKLRAIPKAMMCSGLIELTT